MAAYRVTHIAQLGYEPGFSTVVTTIGVAMLIRNTLADYDLYLLKMNLRDDYSNTSWVEAWRSNGWQELDDDEIFELLDKERECQS